MDNYTKTRAMIGDNRHMLRFLPAVTSHIMAIHMIYIRPFARYLDNPRCRLLPLSIFLDKVPQTCRRKSTSCNRCRELGILVGADEIELAAASESREDSVGMLEGADESESSSNAEDLEVGSRLLKQHVRD